MVTEAWVQMPLTEKLCDYVCKVCMQDMQTSLASPVSIANIKTMDFTGMNEFT